MLKTFPYVNTLSQYPIEIQNQVTLDEEEEMEGVEDELEKGSVLSGGEVTLVKG